MNDHPVSIVFSMQGDEIPQGECDIRSAPDMAKRETIGKRLKRERLKLELTVPDLRAKIKRDHRFEIGESTIRDLEKDKSPNPGFKTIEFVSLGLGLDPLEVISLGLDDPPELESGFTQSQIAQFWKKYSKLDKDRQSFYDENFKMLIERLDRER